MSKPDKNCPGRTDIPSNPFAERNIGEVILDQISAAPEAFWDFIENHPDKPKRKNLRLKFNSAVAQFKSLSTNGEEGRMGKAQQQLIFFLVERYGEYQNIRPHFERWVWAPDMLIQSKIIRLTLVFSLVAVAGKITHSQLQTEQEQQSRAAASSSINSQNHTAAVDRVGDCQRRLQELKVSLNASRNRFSDTQWNILQGAITELEGCTIQVVGRGQRISSLVEKGEGVVTLSRGFNSDYPLFFGTFIESGFDKNSKREDRLATAGIVLDILTQNSISRALESGVEPRGAVLMVQQRPIDREFVLARVEALARHLNENE